MIDSDLLPITRKQRMHMSVIYNMCSIGCIGLYFMYNAVDWLVVALLMYVADTRNAANYNATVLNYQLSLIRPTKESTNGQDHES